MRPHLPASALYFSGSHLPHPLPILTVLCRQGNWRDIIPYDAEMRKFFAARQHLSFADFGSGELEHVRALAWPTVESRRAGRDNPLHSQASSSSKNMGRGSSDRGRGTRSPLDGPKIKVTRHLPKNQQVCGGWNLDKCLDPPKCGRIHGLCDVAGCNESHKRLAHPK